MPESSAAGDGSTAPHRSPAVVVPLPGNRRLPDGFPGPCSAPERPDLAPTELQVLRRLGSGPRGLLEDQAQDRLARCGENTPPAWRPVSWPRRFTRSLRDPFTSVLLCPGLVSAAVNAWATACVTLVLVVVSCLPRSAQEHRADRAAAALRELVATTATVPCAAPARTPPRTPASCPSTSWCPGM